MLALGTSKSRDCLVGKTTISYTGFKPCFKAAFQVTSMLSTSMVPTSWCIHPSKECTNPPAWHACTTPLGIVISHDRMPLMSLGSCIPASLPYVQSWRDSIIGGMTNWWKWVWGGAHFWSLGVAHFPTTHTYQKNWSSSSSKSPHENTIYTRISMNIFMVHGDFTLEGRN
jgi:hypothetical protein